jgi:hypothetical protein
MHAVQGRMAHTQVESAKRHAATDAATAQGAQGRSWYQWATGQQGQQRLPAAGAAGGGRGAQGQPPSPSASSSSESGELSADEWARLQEMMQESEAVGLPGGGRVGRRMVPLASHVGHMMWEAGSMPVGLHACASYHASRILVLFQDSLWPSILHSKNARRSQPGSGLQLRQVCATAWVPWV